MIGRVRERRELEAALEADEAQLKTKLGAFEQVTKTRSAVHLTFITAAGLLRNSHAGIVQSEVTLDDLFRA